MQLCGFMKHQCILPICCKQGKSICDNMVGTYALLDFLGGVDGLGSELCANL